MAVLKESLRDLAVLGGAPAFKDKLHVGRPNIGDRKALFRRIDGLLDRRWLTNDGPLVRELEQKLALLLGVKHCIAVANGTLGLEIAIRALDLKGEVIVPSFTFVATAHALQWQGITPVFADIGRRTYNLDPSKVVELLTPRTTGIIAVHLWGRPCEIDALTDVARTHGLRLLFDAAHAFNCSYRGRLIGGFGDAEVFSFHATKFFNTFEGGAITTNDDDVAEKARLIRNFGFAGYDNVVRLGTNGKMTEVSAAMGLTNLESVESFIEVNRRNYEEYCRLLNGIEGLAVVSYDAGEKCNYQYVVLEVDASVAGITRDQLAEVLWAENVLARRYFYPGCHRMEPYCTLFPDAGLRLRETEAASERVLALPTGTSVTVEDVRAVCAIIRVAVQNAPRLRSLIGQNVGRSFR